MQRRIDATVKAERSVSRRLARLRTAENRLELTEVRRQAQAAHRVVRDSIHAERRQRRQDWECGPLLRPKRDVGERAGVYGTLPQSAFTALKLPKHDPRRAMPLCFADGDRVVVLAGRDKGKIGLIRKVDVESRTCLLDGLNQADIYVDEIMRHEAGVTETRAPFPMPIPLSSLKLVHPIRSKATNKFTDAIIDRLEIRNNPTDTTLLRDPSLRGTRYVPGTDLVIPWPETARSEEKIHADDTARLNVDHISHSRPVLLTPPMPGSVIDELRNRYSKFRTRHEDDYVARLEAREALGEVRREKLAALVRTPREEVYEMRRVRKEAERPRKLTIEQLAAIGEAVERERAEVGRTQ